MRQLDFDYGTTVPITIFIYHDPLVQSIHFSLYAAVFLPGTISDNNLYNSTDWMRIPMYSSQLCWDPVRSEICAQ